jgi:hypothetical protein
MSIGCGAGSERRAPSALAKKACALQRQARRLGTRTIFYNALFLLAAHLHRNWPTDAHPTGKDFVAR